MKTPRRPQNGLRTPLNAILGTEANVRLLRALARAGTPLASGELAKRASLGRTSIYPALEGLEATGIIEFVGAGAQRQVRFRSKHPLGRALHELFNAEALRVDELLRALRDMFREIALQPIAAWMEGITPSDAEDNDALVIWVLADPKVLDVITEHASERVAAIERLFGVAIEVRGLTRSELETRATHESARLKNATLLCGAPPMAFAGQRLRSGLGRLEAHEDHDEQARRLSLAIARKLKRDPGLRREALRQIARRAEKASERERKELKEWNRVLTTMSPARLYRFLGEPSERAKRLRQTLPPDLLTVVEREAALRGD